MNETEARRVLRLIAGYHPGFGANPQMPAVWAHALADLPEAEVTAAVHAHYATAGPWITVADIRRLAATAAGVLPPDPDTALAQAHAWLAWRGPAGIPAPRDGEPTVHPAARAAARLLGWNWIAEAPDGVVRARWRDSYGAQASLAERQALAPGGIAAARHALYAPQQQALPPADDDPEPDAPPNPTRLAALRQQIARAAAPKAPPAPRPDYPPPTAADRDRALAALDAWAAAHANSAPVPGNLAACAGQSTSSPST